MSLDLDRVRAAYRKRDAAFAAIETNKRLDYTDDDLHEFTSALIDAAPELLRMAENAAAMKDELASAASERAGQETCIVEQQAEIAKLKDRRERLRKTLRHARGEIARMATDGGGFSCTVVDDIEALLAETE